MWKLPYRTVLWNRTKVRQELWPMNLNQRWDWTATPSLEDLVCLTTYLRLNDVRCPQHHSYTHCTQDHTRSSFQRSATGAHYTGFHIYHLLIIVLRIYKGEKLSHFRSSARSLFYSIPHFLNFYFRSLQLKKFAWEQLVVCRCYRKRDSFCMVLRKMALMMSKCIQTLR